MISQEVALISVVIPSIVTVLGWIILDYLGRRKDRFVRIAADRRADKLKRVEMSLIQNERRISEFYGPIYNLLLEIKTIAEIKHGKIQPNIEPDKFKIASNFLEKKYFMDTHDRIRYILREKTHLVEDGDIPETFHEYMRHSIMQKIQIELWEKENISTITADGFPLSDNFEKDIKNGLLNALSQRNKLLDYLTMNEINKNS